MQAKQAPNSKQENSKGPTTAGAQHRRRKRGQRKPPSSANSTTKGFHQDKKNDEDKDDKVEKQDPTSKAKETLSSNDSLGEAKHHCLICCDPIKVYSVGVCNHRSLCAMCSLRRRELYKQPECCLCKTELKEVLLISNDDALFEEIDLQTLIHDPKRGLYFDDRTYADQIANMFEHSCSICAGEAVFDSLSALQRHLQQKHNLSYCDLCLQHKKVFLNEQTLYAPTELEKHKKGANQSEMERHQLCEFCKKLYYDKDDLYHHLTQAHETCHICEKDGIRYQYFRNYNSLEEHFRNQHFLCEESQCLAQRFVVFRTALDLKGHDVTCHLADRNLSKSEARAARTLDAAVLFGDSRPHREERGPRKGRGGKRDEPFLFSPGPNVLPNTAPATVGVASLTSDSTRTNPSNRGKGRKKDKKFQAKSNADKKVDESEEAEHEKSELTETQNNNLQYQVEMQMQQTISKEERQIRNKALIEKINTFLGPERFDGFKKLSAELRLGRITPAQYYQRFMNTFGWNKASELFPELVDLLPDPVLRAALLVLHKNATPSDYPQQPQPFQQTGAESFGGGKGSAHSVEPGPIRPFMKSTSSGPPPWSEAHRISGPPSPSPEEFPSLPPSLPSRTSPPLPRPTNDYFDDYDDTDDFQPYTDQSNRFHASSLGQGKASKKKGKQKQVLLRFG